jgi:hypothetical protein
VCLGKASGRGEEEEECEVDGMGMAYVEEAVRQVSSSCKSSWELGTEYRLEKRRAYGWERAGQAKWGILVSGSVAWVLDKVEDGCGRLRHHLTLRYISK